MSSERHACNCQMPCAHCTCKRDDSVERSLLADVARLQIRDIEALHGPQRRACESRLREARRVLRALHACFQGPSMTCHTKIDLLDIVKVLDIRYPYMARTVATPGRSNLRRYVFESSRLMMDQYGAVAI
jgi:hypothetical protein